MIPNLVTTNQQKFIFSDSFNLSKFLVGDRLLLELTLTNAFQRLKDIRFLGGIDYQLVHYPNGAKGNKRHTRYLHSLGVAYLAILYCDAINLSISERKLVCAAALLHDIGHAPLSHSLEPVFKERFGLTHHQATEKIITGQVPLGYEVYNTLLRHNVDIERLLGLITGSDSGYHGFFSGPINFDTIDGILRAYSYMQPNSKLPGPNIVMEAALYRSESRHEQIVDKFWETKNLVYKHLINSRSGVLADVTCQFFMRKHLNKMREDDYYIKEAAVFNKLPGLRDLLTSHLFEQKIFQLLGTSISYFSRHFFIESCSSFFARDDNIRYQQSKNPCTLSPMSGGKEEPISLTQDVFDELWI